MVVAFSGFSGCWEIGCVEEGEGREKERGGGGREEEGERREEEREDAPRVWKSKRE